MTLCRALCDETNISCTYYSNHTLQTLIVHRTLPSVLIDVDILKYGSSLVTMNLNDNKFEVARQKILKTHFSGGSDYLHVFASMPETVMPFVFAWIGRNTLGRESTLMFNVVRGFPVLFRMSHESTTGVKKRSR